MRILRMKLENSKFPKTNSDPVGLLTKFSKIVKKTQKFLTRKNKTDFNFHSKLSQDINLKNFPKNLFRPGSLPIRVNSH